MPELNQKLNQKPVVLQGLHLSVHTPTEERLTVQIEDLEPVIFAELGLEIEDWMEIVDEEYKVRETRGRGWQGRGKRITKDERVRLLKFSPFPSSLSNVLRSIRRELYIEIHKQCSVLEGSQQGRYKQNIYILPYVNAGAFMVYLQTLDEKINELNKDIQLFQKTDNAEIVFNILTKYKVAGLLDKQWSIPHITFDVTPLSLDPNVVLNMVEAQRGTIADQLNEEEQQGLERLQRSLQVQYKETVIKTIESLKTELNGIMSKFIMAKKLDPENARIELEQLRRKAASIGLEAMASSVIEPLLMAIDDPQKAVENFGTETIFGKQEVSKEVNMRIEGLIDNIFG
uniref:Uncharacterized protein n=1 Tax=viral metagenome TaxID=1070528 RepID=A0A6M3JZ59_9ZZZZ